jgi:hypothetical protein
MADRYSIIKGNLPKRDPVQEEKEEKEHALLSKFFKKSGSRNPEGFIKALARLYKNGDISKNVYNEWKNRAEDQKKANAISRAIDEETGDVETDEIFSNIGGDEIDENTAAGFISGCGSSGNSNGRC